MKYLIKTTCAPRQATQLRATTLGAMAAFVLVLVLPAVLKAIKVYYSRIDISILGILTVFTADIAVAFATGIALLLLCNILGASKWGRWLFWVISCAYLSIVLGLTVIEHQVWMKTSTLIDWGILSYTLQHHDDLAVVVASESKWIGKVILIGSFILGLTPIVVDIFITKVCGRSVHPKKGHIGFFLALLVLFSILSVFLPAPFELRALSKPVAVSLIKEAILSVETRNTTLTDSSILPLKDNSQGIKKILEKSRIEKKDSESSPQNVLYIILESTRFDATSVYLPELNTTPRLFDLTKHGAVVERVYVDMPHTSKALVSLLCGYAPRYSFEINENRVGGLPRPCLAHILSHLEFRTGFFQSATSTFENRGQLVENAGYQTFMGQESYGHGKFEKVNYLATEDKVMVEPLFNWIDKESDRPFFATMLTGVTHHKYRTPGNFKRSNFYLQFQDRAPIPVSSIGNFRQYLNAVHYADEMLGELINGLKQRGILENTLVVVVGDHGQGFEEHGARYHNDVIYEEGIRVPLVLSNPKLFQKTQWIEGLRKQIDIAPTILSMLNINYPFQLFEGQNLLKNSGYPRIYSTCWFERRCIAEIRDYLKVIYHFDHKPMEVYNLKVDPLEQANLLVTGQDQLHYRTVADKAKQRLEAKLSEMEMRFKGSETQKADWMLNEEPQPQYERKVRVGDAIQLIGFDANSLDVRPGDMWEANLYFKCLKPSEQGWRLFYRLQTVDERRIQTDYFPANGHFDLTQCRPNLVISDQLRILIPEDIPPGPVSLFWGSVYLKHRGPKHTTNPRLKWRKLIPLNRGILIRHRGVLLARINVKDAYRPELATLRSQSIVKEPPDIQSPLGVQFEEPIVLEKADIQETRVRRMGSFSISTTWHATDDLDGPWLIFTHLVHIRSGRFLYEQSHTPVAGLHPIANWRDNTWIKDQYIVKLPKFIPTGEYQVWSGIYRRNYRMRIRDVGNGIVDADNRVLLGTIRVTR